MIATIAIAAAAARKPTRHAFRPSARAAPRAASSGATMNDVIPIPL